MVTRRTKFLLRLFLVVLLSAIPVVFFALWLAATISFDDGSPELAAAWRAELVSYRTPEVAAARDHRVHIIRFENGDWVFGLAQNSHGIWHGGGGTIVVMDSRGETHAFLGGHVCGEGYLGTFNDATSLDKFYDLVKEQGFDELNAK